MNFETESIFNMNKYIKSRAILVKKKIEEDFGKENVEFFFDKFKGDKRTVSFIEYYNKTILDKEKIRFGKFKYQWAIQGMPKSFYTYFDKNYDELIKEIKKDKNIETFFKKYCIHDRKEVSFCSKLFHTILPSEFSPLDTAIRKRFNLDREDSIKNVLIIKRGYELFIKENSELMNLIRKILSKSKFSYLRINELSNVRILDMYYWFKENRDRKRI